MNPRRALQIPPRPRRMNPRPPPRMVTIAGKSYAWPRSATHPYHHQYRHRHGRPSRCRRCGTQMRRASPTAAPEYRAPGDVWSTINPGCVP